MIKKHSPEHASPTLIIILLLVAVLNGHPVIAMLLGTAVALVYNKPAPDLAKNGGKFALQTAIVLLGFKLTANELLQMTGEYSVIVTGYVLLTLAAGWGISRALGRSKTAGPLLSAGTAICGGTTIASLSPVIGAKPAETGVALALVFTLNAMAMLLFPPIGHWLGLSQQEFGLWSALAIHDTSSVVATAAMYGHEAEKVATTLKLGRTLWLIPIMLIAALVYRAHNVRVRLPLFIVLFIAAAALSSLVALPTPLLQGASQISRLLLTAALFLIGLDIDRDTLKGIRGDVLIHGLGLWILATSGVLGWIFLSR
jgi:uncharacterized integral membrane protein (TIGR00698 family)